MEKQKNTIEKIGALIPGYSGYADREGRRNADKLLRDGIADKLSSIEKVLYDRINTAIKNGDKELMHSLESHRKQLDTMGDKIRHAPYGETSFFADAKIKEEELGQLHELDLSISESVNLIAQRAEGAGLDELNSLVKQLQAGLDERNNYLNQF